MQMFLPRVTLTESENIYMCTMQVKARGLKESLLTCPLVKSKMPRGAKQPTNQTNKQTTNQPNKQTNKQTNKQVIPNVYYP